MKVELQQVNQIDQVPWEHFSNILKNQFISNGITIEKDILHAISEVYNIRPLERYTKTLSLYENQTKDGVIDSLQRKNNNLRIDKSKEHIYKNQKTGEDLSQKQRITKDQLKNYFKPYVYSSIAPGKFLKNGQAATLFELLLEETDEYIIEPENPRIYASTVAAKIFSNHMLIDEKVKSFSKWQKIFGDYFGLKLGYKINQTKRHSEFTKVFTSLN
jgi:hypothetical protein